jgi:ATP-dependent helicase/nuclease subunit A
MPDLTEQQQRALEVRGTSVALSAGAGCGKTTVLTERFLAALTGDEPTPLDRLVALTFTDKAAGELRGRVRDACRKQFDTGDDPDYWRGILRGLAAAPIGTFHTFCGEIVRRFAPRAGVDQGFTILDETIASTFRESAVDATLRVSLRDRDTDLRELAVEYNLDIVRKALVSLMANRSAPQFADWAGKTVDEIVATWRRVFETEAKPAIIRRFLQAFEPFAMLLDTYDCHHHPKMRERRETILELIPQLVGSSDPAPLLLAIREQAMIKGGGAPKEWPSSELYAAFKDGFEEVRDKHVKSAIEGLTFDEALTQTAADQGIRFARLATRAWDEYESVKHARGALDYNDLLLKALSLLRDDGEAVRDELARRFDLILVDEFQDTDPVQDEIIRRIAGNEVASGRLFLVGDFKQSIYGFRDAQPQLFARYRTEFPLEGRLSLTTNYRSRAAILDFVNGVFADAFDEDYEPLRPGIGDTLPPEQPAVVFAWPAPSEKNPTKQKGDADRAREEEAARLATLIRFWIEEKRPVRDRATGKTRAMHAGDVAILFRAHSGFIPFEKALDDQGIDYHVIGGTAFYAQQEVQDLINVLTVLDDPHDALALAGALRSPFFAMSDEALFWLATVREGDLAAGLARCDAATLPDLSDEDRRRGFRAQELLVRWRSYKDREPIAALVGRVLEESGFEAALLGEPFGDRKRANARKLVRTARRFDSEGGFTLADFVARLRADRNDPPKEEQASTTDEVGQAVRLLTVHKAKGLEFPVVVVPDLDRKVNSPSKPVIFDDQLGLLVNPKRDDEGDVESERGAKRRDTDLRPLGWVVHHQRINQDEKDEAIRVFYVATTRARDLLVLSTSGDPGGSSSTPVMKLLRKRFDFETGECLAPLPDGWPVPRADVRMGTPIASAPSPHRRQRPPVRAVARLIESALEVPPDHATPATNRSIPTYLELDPSHTLSPADASVDRLVRAILVDPRSRRPGALGEVATELARRQMPTLPPRVAAEAVERVRYSLEGPLGREIATADEVVRDIPWAVSWSDGTVAIEGSIDLAYRDSKGDWRIVQIADARVNPLNERLRLALSGSLAPGLGCGPVVQGWRITHGPDGGIQADDDFSDVAISALLDALPYAPRISA